MRVHSSVAMWLGFSFGGRSGFIPWWEVGDEALGEDGFNFAFPEGEDAPALGF